MDSLLQDLRYGARQLWRSPAFTVAAIATLALGIGANTALFTMLRAIVSQPVAGVNASDRLVWVTPMRPGGPQRMSRAHYVQFRDGLRQYLDLASLADSRFSISGGTADAEEVEGQLVQGDFFGVLRTPFALGRGFTRDEDSQISASHVAVLSHGFWQRRFNGDSAVLGKSIVVNGTPLTIVGVAARGFNGPELETPKSVWVPRAIRDSQIDRSRALSAIGRLKEGVREADVLPAVRTIAARIAKDDDRAAPTATLYSARSGLPPGAEDEVMPVAILGAAVTAIVLLIACANVSNLLLARAVARRREIAVRLSLGASRGRVTRQLLTESLLLATSAGALGLWLAYATNNLLLQTEAMPILLDVRPDATIIAFTFAAALLAAVFFGLVPALESTRGDIAAAVKEGMQARDPRRARLQGSLVVAQVALSLALLTTGALLVRSMQKANSVDVGFDATSRVIGLSFNLGLIDYSDERADQFVRTLIERGTGVPGVQGVSLADIRPLSNRSMSAELTVENADSSLTARARTVSMNSVRPAFFNVLGMRLIRGRDFGSEDAPGSQPVMIVSEQVAKRLWPGADPLGKRVKMFEDGDWITVIGVASDALVGGPTEQQAPFVYLPQTQRLSAKELTLLARTTGDPRTLIEFLRREVRAMDPSIAISAVNTMDAYKRIKLAPRMTGARILGGFGALALLLACIGVYGLMAFTVLQRTREIGIRIALGAKHRDVLRLFVARGMRLTGVGVAIGLALSLAMSRLLQGMLFGLTPTDAGTFIGVAALLAGVALVACWLPARRAATVDPAIALRTD
jgi:putative ABC transport system permease protein